MLLSLRRYDAQVGDPKAQMFPTLNLLIDAAPYAKTAAKHLFEDEVSDIAHV